MSNQKERGALGFDCKSLQECFKKFAVLPLLLSSHNTVSHLNSRVPVNWAAGESLHHSRILYSGLIKIQEQTIMNVISSE